MGQPALAEMKIATVGNNAGQRCFEMQELDKHIRFHRFLVKEFSSCRTEAEKEILLPELKEARMQIQNLEKNLRVSAPRG